MHLNVWALARRSGLTLHPVGQICLLRSSAWSDGGAGLYSDDGVARLQRIQALQPLGHRAQADVIDPADSTG